MLNLVTFTGIDSRTSKEWALAVSAKYKRVEFGILIGSHTGDPNYSIFPDFSVINSWKVFAKAHGIQLSLHLCGRWSRLAFGTESTGMDRLRLLDLTGGGFTRCQVNWPRGKGWTSADKDHLWRFLFLMEPTAILQHRGPFVTAPFQHPKVEYLFDRSGGRGVRSISSWPAPLPNRRCGYSGGLGPKTILDAVPFLRSYEDYRIWIDMESGIRENGWLDIHKVEGVLEQLRRENLI